MKVYILLRGIAYEGSDIMGVYASLEVANAEANVMAYSSGFDWSGEGITERSFDSGTVQYSNSSGDKYYTTEWGVV